MSKNTQVTNLAHDMVPHGTHEELTVSNETVKLEALYETASALPNFGAKPGGKFYVLVQPSANVRFTLDGATDPTASIGFVLVANESPLFSGTEAMKMRMIREGDADVTVRVQPMIA